MRGRREEGGDRTREREIGRRKGQRMRGGRRAGGREWSPVYTAWKSSWMYMV